MKPALPGQGVSFSAAQLPAAIDYPAALALRQMDLIQDELPKYLLALEVSVLLYYVPDLHRRCCWQPSGTPGCVLTRRWR